MRHLASRLLPLSDQFKAAQARADRLQVVSTVLHQAQQLERFRLVWRDCVADVPYYRDLVTSGRAPREIDSWSTFREIPILDRRVIQENSASFQRLTGPPDRYISTGGSTGQPVQLGEWRQGMEVLRAAKMVPWIRHGYTPESHIVLIWGHAHLLGSGWRRYYNHAIRRTKDWLAGYHRIDAYTLDPLKAKQIASDIIRIRPAALIGYAAVLDLLCRYTTEYHSELRRAGVKFVMPCAEPPPRPDTFQLLRSVFGCPIVQEFSGVDFGHVGYKVDEAPYTLFPDLNILEAESNANDNQVGNALVTTLYHRYVPLVRYRQGDVISGVLRDKDGLVVKFDEQAGRVNDMIMLSDGTSVHSVALIHCFKDESSILNVQLQLTDGGASFALVVKNGLTNEAEQIIRERLKKIHQELANAKFYYMDDLSTNRAGKRRWVSDERTKVELGD